MKGTIKEKILSIAIAIILTMFIFYGISTFYPRPEREDYCEGIGPARTKADCEAANGKWSYDEGPRPAVPVDTNKTYEFGYCECTVYENLRESYERNVFIIALILGLVAVLLGAVVLKLASVSSGVMAGGILTVIIGTMRFWGDMPDFARFICLGIALAILIVLAYKKVTK